MIVQQLNPPLPLTTPKGSALAHLVIDYGPEHDLIWVCFQDDTGECWSWANPEIRAQKNVTMGRKLNNLPRDPWLIANMPYQKGASSWAW